MGEGSAGDEIDAGGGDAGEALEGDAAAGFELDAAGDEGDAALHFLIGHVVEEDDVDAAQGEEAFDLGEAVGFEFDAHAGVLAVDGIDGLLELGKAGFGEEVIVFDHDHVVEAVAVVGAAACEDGGLFQSAPAGSGLAGIEQAAGGGAHGLDVVVGEGGDAAEALEEIEGGAFAAEQGAGGAGDFHDGIAGQEGIAVFPQGLDAEVVVEKLEDGGGDGHAGEDAGLFGNDAGVAAGVCGDEELCGDIPVSNVFLQCHANEGLCGSIQGIHGRESGGSRRGVQWEMRVGGFIGRGNGLGSRSARWYRRT